MIERRESLTQAFLDRYGTPPTIWTRAPGRVDLMGSHTDYNLGYVLTLSIDRDTWVAARPRSDRSVRLASLNVDTADTLDLLQIDHSAAAPWVDYVAGVAQALLHDGLAVTGCDLLVHSTIPLGGGLSSSAALELASALAFQALGGWQSDRLSLARLCQRAEREFVGVNCGILDQYTSAFGVADAAIVLDCRSTSHTLAPIPADVAVVICDTRAKRELTGSEYSERRASCEQAVQALQRWYPHAQALRDISLAQLEAHREGLTPSQARRARFIIEESQRVLQLGAALAQHDLTAVGRITAASFAGARDLYQIASPEMVAMHAAMWGAPGRLGARQAGAGFGGCMVALVAADQVDAFSSQVASVYHTATGILPEIYPVRPSPGAGLL